MSVFNIGITPDYSYGRTGRIEEHLIEHTAHSIFFYVNMDYRDTLQPEPGNILFQSSDPLRIDLERNDLPFVIHETRYMCSFPSGCSAGIEDSFSGRGIKKIRYKLGRLILYYI